MTKIQSHGVKKELFRFAITDINVIPAGERHNKTAPTTLTVVLSAFLSLTNLSTSS